MGWMTALGRWIESLGWVMLRAVFFRRMRLLLRTLFLLVLLVVHPRVLGYGEGPRSRGCSPLLLGHPMNELELCRRDVSDCTRDCIREDAMAVPNAEMIDEYELRSLRYVWRDYAWIMQQCWDCVVFW